MNQKRRKRICEINNELMEILDEEDNYRECMPENLQGTLRYEESELVSAKLNDAIEALSEI